LAWLLLSPCALLPPCGGQVLFDDLSVNYLQDIGHAGDRYERIVQVIETGV
jgi:hypothetical protein